MKAWIKGLGWATPAGFGQGRQFETQPLQPGELQIPTRKDLFARIDRRFGRLDDFSRIGLAAVTFCLRDAGAEAWQEKRPLGIIAASRYGCLQTDLDYLQTLIPQQGKLASPNLFAYTLPNCLLGEAALRFGLTGNSLIINRRDPARLAALQAGLEELSWSEQCGVLVGIVDLVAPPELAAADDLPGSLFLLLETDPRNEVSSYGELELQNEQLYFNGERLENLSQLVAACLKLPVTAT
jgi:3-oxoacyl-[acyl-carrier-protein] synthase II